jgi:hypothetical protein
MTDASAYPSCVHGRKIYERCEACEAGAKAGAHGGFERAPLAADLSVALDTIARTVQGWLDDHEKSLKDAEGFQCDITDDFHMIRFPGGEWPSRGMFKNWVSALRAAASSVETTCDSAPAAAGVSRTEPSANPSEGSGPAAVGAVWCIEAGYEGSFCPFTKRVYMMHIDHPELGRVPTYGGPFDSYTVPTPDEDGHLRCERYDHDVGDWVEGGEPTGLLVIAERHAPETTVQPDEKCGNCGDDYSKHLGERLICPDAAMPDIYRWTAEPTQVKAEGEPNAKA